jgi:hypothetical protein
MENKPVDLTNNNIRMDYLKQLFLKDRHISIYLLETYLEMPELDKSAEERYINYVVNNPYDTDSFIRFTTLKMYRALVAEIIRLIGLNKELRDYYKNITEENEQWPNSICSKCLLDGEKRPTTAIIYSHSNNYNMVEDIRTILKEEFKLKLSAYGLLLS